MIEVTNLTKRYGSHPAVRGLSFEVPSGQVCGFLGPNGAGKSTTLRMLTGFVAPTEGTITIGGLDALARPLEARAKIGYMPEACPLYPEMRVSEYLRYRAELKGVPRREIKTRVEKALEQATVADVASRIIGQLSKGYRQRVGLADALVGDPPLLVLDEPTAGLDPNQIRQVRSLIKELAKNKTVLISTHILPEVEAICDRVLIINKGRLVSEGDPRALRGTGPSERIQVEVRGAAAEVRACLESIEGVTVVGLAGGGETPVRAELDSSDPDAVERVFAAVVKAGLVLRELRRHEQSLEDIFADLTTDEEVADEEEDSEPDDSEESDDSDDSEEPEDEDDPDEEADDEEEEAKR